LLLLVIRNGLKLIRALPRALPPRGTNNIPLRILSAISTSALKSQLAGSPPCQRTHRSSRYAKSLRKMTPATSDERTNENNRPRRCLCV
jgi:hypothetical protein